MIGADYIICSVIGADYIIYSVIGADYHLPSDWCRLLSGLDCHLVCDWWFITLSIVDYRLLAGVDCSGNENNIGDCDEHRWRMSSCSGGEPAAVICDPGSGSSSRVR